MTLDSIYIGESPLGGMPADVLYSVHQDDNGPDIDVMTVIAGGIELDAYWLSRAVLDDLVELIEDSLASEAADRRAA